MYTIAKILDIKNHKDIIDVTWECSINNRYSIIESRFYDRNKSAFELSMVRANLNKSDIINQSFHVSIFEDNSKVKRIDPAKIYLISKDSQIIEKPNLLNIKTTKKIESDCLSSTTSFGAMTFSDAGKKGQEVKKKNKWIKMARQLVEYKETNKEMFGKYLPHFSKITGEMQRMLLKE